MSQHALRLAAGYGAAALLFALAVVCHFNADRVQRHAYRWHNRLRSRSDAPAWAVRLTGRNYVPFVHFLGVVLFLSSLAAFILTVTLLRP